MLISRSVQTKIVALAGACLLATAGAIVGYAALSVRSTAIKTATAQAKSAAAGVADKVAGLINTNLMLAQSVSMTLSGVHREDVELDISRQAVMGILQTLLASNEGVHAIFTVWEPDAFDSLDAAYEGVEGADAAGRFVPYVYRADQGQVRTGSVSQLEKTALAPDGSPLNAFYEIPKATRQAVALGPRPSAAPDLAPGDVVAVVAPIVIEDTFYGVVGVEVDAARIADAVSVSQGSTEQALFGHTGRVVAASAATSSAAADDDPSRWPGADEAWRTQETRVWTADGQLYCYAPVPLQASTSRWGLVSRMPRSSVTAQASTLMWRLVGISSLLLAAALLAMFFVAKSVARPIQRAASMLREIADGQGDLTARLDVRTNDEIGVMADAYNTFVHSLCQLIGEVANVTDRVDSVSDAAAQTSRLTVEKIDEQRRRVEQIASAVEQLAQSIDSAASIAENTAKTAAAAGETAVEGSEVVANAIQCMETIRDEIAKTKEVVGALGSRSEQI
ncbi:MAG: methyl-accepting chemotaxis protein, partial [Planctomycetota bacterium]